MSVGLTISVCSISSDIIAFLAPAGTVYPRVDILDLHTQPKPFSLFIRALNNIMTLGYKYEGSDAVNWEELGRKSSVDSLSFI